MTIVLLDRLTHRGHILETWNGNLRFKASSAAAAAKKEEEDNHVLPKTDPPNIIQKWPTSRWKTRVTSELRSANKHCS